MRKQTWNAVWAVGMAAAILLGSAGCKKSETSGAAPNTEAQPTTPVNYATIDTNTAGSISGTVKFAGKAPARVEIDMKQDPACGLTGGTNMSEQYMVHEGKLQNVYIYVKDGLGNLVYAPSSTPVVLDQKGCRYVPHVIAVMVGLPLKVINSDPTMHNVHTMPQDGSAELNVSEMPKTGTTQQVFRQAQVMLPVRCNNHPWMQAFINVAPNPFFAVSDQNGHFEIQGLPPGTYTLVAVHEELGQQEAKVTVAAKQAAPVSFSFSAANGAAAGQ